MGEQQVKNITRPMRVYRIQLGEAPTAGASPAAVLALPDKPSIAVLPFQNMSGDPEQEYFTRRHGRGPLEDVFAVQEEVTRSIVAAVAPQVELAEVAHARRAILSDDAPDSPGGPKACSMTR